MENPYRSPNSAVLERERSGPELDDVASGQKLIIYAILLYFVAAASRVVIGPLAILPLLICLGMSWTGIYRLGRGLGYAMWVRILLLILMLVPLVGLIVLVVLSSRATSRLKEAGYSVGLMGVRDYAK
ncbi:MAG TPA: hypothetical protein VJ798_07950 [Rhizomicrobium sp.]|nr:hypothetical protein [Rhizomicrobium sp.]